MKRRMFKIHRGSENRGQWDFCVKHSGPRVQQKTSQADVMGALNILKEETHRMQQQWRRDTLADKREHKMKMSHHQSADTETDTNTITKANTKKVKIKIQVTSEKENTTELKV